MLVFLRADQNESFIRVFNRFAEIFRDQIERCRKTLQRFLEQCRHRVRLQLWAGHGLLFSDIVFSPCL